MANDDIGELLSKWEDSYKKGLLSFWILPLLYKRSSYPYEMSAEVAKISQGTISVDDNSIYRALNRFESVGIVKSELQQSNTGPQRRYYSTIASQAKVNLCLRNSPSAISKCLKLLPSLNGLLPYYKIQVKPNRRNYGNCTT